MTKSSRLLHSCTVCLLGLIGKNHIYGVRLKLKPNEALSEIPDLELRGITCHMGSHSVTCHPTQVKALRFNPSQ